MGVNSCTHDGLKVYHNMVAVRSAARQLFRKAANHTIREWCRKNQERSTRREYIILLYGRGNISGQRTVRENFTKPPALPVVEHTIRESLAGS